MGTGLARPPVDRGSRIAPSRVGRSSILILLWPHSLVATSQGWHSVQCAPKLSRPNEESSPIKTRVESARKRIGVFYQHFRRTGVLARRRGQAASRQRRADPERRQ